ncbi:MAG: prepilin-type N-terminal cleavage/methylation domain-containing protein [Sphingomonadaceae bacterium]|nr:prepilin-type N-terminal cleavage/methylation domain-containing protein [Sphingomonadaceae bacterium]
MSAGAPGGATGPATSRQGVSRRADRQADRGAAAADAGLTLIEMLVVLAILAVATGASVLSLAPRGDATAAAARRLARTIQAAADRSLATGHAAVLVTTGGGYGIDDAHTALPPETRITGAVPAVRVAFGGEPFALIVARGHERWTVAFDGAEAAATRGSPP